MRKTAKNAPYLEKIFVLEWAWAHYSAPTVPHYRLSEQAEDKGFHGAIQALENVKRKGGNELQKKHVKACFSSP